MIQGNELIGNYLKIVSVSGAAFYGFVWLSIRFGGAFGRVSRRKVHENGSEICIFTVFSAFVLGSFLCFKLTKRKRDPAPEKPESPDRTIPEKGHSKPLIKGKALRYKKEYLLESRERDERKTLIGSLDDNDSF